MSSSKIVIVTPVLNDWESLEVLMKHISRLEILDKAEVTFLIVDDGSHTLAPMELPDAKGNVTQIKIIRLQANQGHQRAIALGLAYVNDKMECDYAIVLDSDGEDSPDAIAPMINAHEQDRGAIILAERRRRSETLAFRTFYKIYKFIFGLLTGQSISFGNFSLVPSNRIPNLLYNSGIWNNYAATIMRSRIPMTLVPTDRGRRYRGQSKMSFVSLIIHGLSAISVFTDIVISRIISFLMLLSVLAAASISFIIYIKFFTQTFVPGYATNLILFVVTILFLCLFFGFLFVLMLLSLRSQSSAAPAALLNEYVREVQQLL